MARKISAVNRRQGLVNGQSETELAALIRQKLQINIDPRVLRDFVRSNFVLLSVLTHEIHGAELPNQPMSSAIRGATT